jgi:peptidoglycan-N-acetylglucosamine deacetylase
MRRRLRITAAFVLTLIALTVMLWQISRSRTFQLFGELVPRVETPSRIIALTFDDGPTPLYTDSILAVLARSDVRATFFVTGRELEENIDEGRRIVAAGHELGNHTWSHERMVLVSPTFIQQELERTDSMIRLAGYEGEIHFRPPYGFKLFGLPRYLASVEKKTIMWDIEPESYPELGSDATRIVEHVMENVRPGSIIIMHVMYPSRSESLEAVPLLIDRLKKQGYTFATVSRLLSSH